MNSEKKTVTSDFLYPLFGLRFPFSPHLTPHTPSIPKTPGKVAFHIICDTLFKRVKRQAVPY
jgi:hypothetical protein